MSQVLTSIFFSPSFLVLRRPELPVLKQEESDFLANMPQTRFTAFHISSRCLLGTCPVLLSTMGL